MEDDDNMDMGRFPSFSPSKVDWSLNSLAYLLASFLEMMDRRKDCLERTPSRGFDTWT